MSAPPAPDDPSGSPTKSAGSSGEARSSNRRNEFDVSLEDGTILTIKLTFWDKVMRMLLSKEEFEARMLEKIEKAKETHRRKVQSSPTLWLDQRMNRSQRKSNYNILILMSPVFDVYSCDFIVVIWTNELILRSKRKLNRKINWLSRCSRCL